MRQQIFSTRTLSVSFPFGKTLLFALLLCPLLLLLLEVIAQFLPIQNTPFVPSYDRKINYPEIDLKLARFISHPRGREINCLLLGNSMVDFGTNPTIFNSKDELQNIKQPICFNFALEAMMPETTSKLAKVLIKKNDIELIILGISPIDFVGEAYETRKFGQSPWFQHFIGKNNLEGWLIENSKSYKYWLSFLKYRDWNYRSKIWNMNNLIDQNGFQIRQPDRQIFQVNQVLNQKSFEISESDFLGLYELIQLKTSKRKIVIVEMPDHPDFLAYYLPGGEKGYEELFINPIKAMLEINDIVFIRSQPVSAEIITPDGWIDHSHLNEKGANQFSTWLADQLAK